MKTLSIPTTAAIHGDLDPAPANAPVKPPSELAALVGVEDTSSCLRRQTTSAQRGRPSIFNTDQGSQFTSRPSPARWRAQGSRSPWMAAVVGWTTSSIETGCGGRSIMRHLSPRAMPTAARPRQGIANWIAFYNGRRLLELGYAAADGGLARTDAGREGCGHDGQR